MENEKKTVHGQGYPHHKKHKNNHKKSYFIDPTASQEKPNTQTSAQQGNIKSDEHNSPTPHKNNKRKPQSKNKHTDNINNDKKKQIKNEELTVLAADKDSADTASTQPIKNSGKKSKNNRNRRIASSQLALSLSDISSAENDDKNPVEPEEQISIENLTLEEILGEAPKTDTAPSTETEDVPMTEVVGIRFKSSGKIYYFDPVGKQYSSGKHAIVETARGQEYGEIVFGNKFVKESDTVPPLRPVIRTATEADIQHHKENKEKEDSAFKICNEKILEHGLDMKLIDVQYTFDNSKLLFYFTSAGRVDFRELVKDLASVFRTRIELRQIGIRDEAKMMGGLGPCGRSLCCSLFLADFGQVSIKMAKEQNLSLNSSKISGVCGRLMCCLRYEYETYEYEIKRTPPIDSLVKTPDGIGTVTEMSPLAGTVKVRLSDAPDMPPKTYHRNDITVIQKKQPSEDNEH